MKGETSIQRIGDDAVITIPQSLLAGFGLEAGSRVHLVATGDGLLIAPFNEEFERAMSIAERGAKKYHRAMRELAKGPDAPHVPSSSDGEIPR